MNTVSKRQQWSSTPMPLASKPQAHGLHTQPHYAGQIEGRGVLAQCETCQTTGFGRLSVEGYAKLSLEPDLATFTVTVEVSEKTEERGMVKARADVARLLDENVQRVRASIQQAKGTAASETLTIVTNENLVSAVRTYEGDTTRYQGLHVMSVTCDAKTVGPIMSAAESDVSPPPFVGSPVFITSEAVIVPGVEATVKKAYAAAKRKYELSLAAMGFDLVCVSSMVLREQNRVYEAEEAPVPYLMETQQEVVSAAPRAQMLRSAPSHIEPRKQVVDAIVDMTVVYKARA